MGNATAVELSLQAEVLQLRARVAELENERQAARQQSDDQLTALRGKNDKLSAVIASINDEVWFADTDKRFTLANPSALREFNLADNGGIAVANLAASLEVFGPDGSPRPVEDAPPLRALKGEVVTREGEIIRTPGTGQLRHREVSSAPVRDAAGTIVGSVCLVRDITERKRSEDALRESHKLLAADLDAMTRLREIGTLFAREGKLAPVLGEIVDAAIAISGADFGNIQLLKPEANVLRIAAHRGYPQWWVDFWNTVSPGHGSCGTALERGERVIVEDVEQSPIFIGKPALEIQLKAGVRAVQSTPLVTRSGRPLGMFSTQYRTPRRPDERMLRLLDLLARQAADIIERAQSEEALRESEERLRMTLEAGQVGTFEFWPETGNLLWDDQNKRIWGLRPGEEWTYTEAIERLHPNDRERLEGVVRAALNPASDGSYDCEYRILLPNGPVHWTVAKGRVYFEGEGENRRAVRMVGIQLDITERKEAEERLFETNQRLQALMEALPVGVSFSDDAIYQRITGNPAVLAQFEVASEDNLSASAPDPAAPGRQVRFFQNGREIADTELPLQRAVSDGCVIAPMELEVRLPSGRTWFAEGSGAPIRDRRGNVVGGVAVTVDITERKRSEERLRQAQKLESLGLLAGGVAHDFNNLLVGVIGNASLAVEMLPPDDPATELMEKVVKTGERAAHLTRQMLAYSGKGKFLLETLDLSALVRDIIELVRPSIPKKVALNLDLREGLPSIEADRGQVQQILMNLAINAGEAIGSHDGLITVRTGTQVVDGTYLRQHPETADLPPREYVLLEVSDNGCGMDPAVQAKIFDPFFSTKFTGRGLGLAAVAGIVRGHKGAIVVTSAPRKGTIFAVLFPPAAHAAERTTDVAARTLVQGSGVVLVIDDEQLVREMAKRALEISGYTVLAADGGLTAIDILKRHPGKIDLVVLDLSMPGMSGEETLPELRKIRPEVKVFVSSGYSEASAMTVFTGQRVAGFLQKPYTAAALAEKVKIALG